MIIARTIKKLIIWYQLFCICFNHGLKCVIEFANKDGENNRARPTGGLFKKNGYSVLIFYTYALLKSTAIYLNVIQQLKKPF